MIEVHLVRGEATAAVVTWDVTKFAEERGCRVLTAPDPFDLAIAIGRAVADVVGPLVAHPGYGSI